MNTSITGILTSWISPRLMESLTDAALKCSLLLLLALAISLLAGSRSPAWRNWVLSLALISLPPVFALSVSFPEWRWRDALSLPHPETLSAPTAVRMSPLVVEIQPLPETAALPAAAPFEPALPSFLEALFLAWAGGSILTFFLMLARQAIAMNRRRRFARVRRGILVDRLEEECRRAGLKRSPALFIASGWVMPSTWGITNPAILLPREAAAWPLRKLQHVLWHEMAHIARADLLTALLSAPAAILLWFHPLVWLARHQSRQLREAACDDWVLTHGNAEAPAYSADLLAIVRHQGRQVFPVGGMAMAQSSKVGSRVHRLLCPNAPRQPLTALSRTVLTTMWCTLTAFTTLLISCRTTSPVPAPAESPVISISGKAGPGKALIQFSLIEITGTRDTANPYLTLAENASIAALAGDSLRDLSQKRGVDLYSLPSVREGQTVDYAGGAYRLNLSGAKSVSGDTILTQAAIRIDGKPSPLTFESLRIPNGGFVVLPGTFQPAAPKDKESRNRVLALHAASHPLPRKSGGDTVSFPLPGDASLPSGARLISYEVHFIEKEPDRNWPGDQPLPQRCTAKQAAKILALMRVKRGLSIASYPKTTTLAGKEVDMRSLMAKTFERPRRPSEPAKDEHGHTFLYMDSVEVGTRLKLTGRPSGDWLVLDVTFEVKGITGEKTFPGGLRAPVVGTVSLDSRIGLDDDATCCFISGINPPGEKTGTELCIFVATSQSINP